MRLDIDKLERVQRKATRLISIIRSLCYEDRLRFSNVDNSRNKKNLW